MAFSFFGGVHPKENKWYACDKETQVFPAPDILVIPMSQHIGAGNTWVSLSHAYHLFSLG